MPPYRPELKNILLLEGLSSSAFRALDAVARSATYDDGQIIVLQGDTDAPIIFVINGHVRVFRTSPEGREQTLIQLGPGDAFNMPVAFSEDQTAPASARAVGKVRALLFSTQEFRHLVSNTPEIALALLKDFSNKLHHLADLSSDLSLRSVRGRLARFLLMQSKISPASSPHWNQEEIAMQIGTVREVVSRTLRSLVKDGLIKMERHRISIVDAERLEKEAD